MNKFTKNRRMEWLLALTFAVSAALPAASYSQSLDKAQSLDKETAAALDAALAGAHRSDRNKARDQYRHPKETLTFFGLRRDMTVVEVWPGGGWYTEILAPALKGKGKLYAAQYGPTATSEYQHREDAALVDKIKKAPDVYGDVKFTSLWGPGQLAIAPPGSADLVLTFRNVHNWVNPNSKQDVLQLFGALFTALKPGGVLGVVDHRWPNADNEDPKAANGYISEERVIALAKSAGFEYVGRSDVNANPKDTHDHPRGVWSLPPSASSRGGEDQQKYIAIGESDRLTLKFRKPVGGK